MCICASTNDARHGRAVNPPHYSVYVYIYIYLVGLVCVCVCRR